MCVRVRVGATSVDTLGAMHPRAHLLNRLHIFNDASNVVRGPSVWPLAQRRRGSFKKLPTYFCLFSVILSLFCPHLPTILFPSISTQHIVKESCLPHCCAACIVVLLLWPQNVVMQFAEVVFETVPY